MWNYFTEWRNQDETDTTAGLVVLNIRLQLLFPLDSAANGFGQSGFWF
jgi:hypothetical protein